MTPTPAPPASATLVSSSRQIRRSPLPYRQNRTPANPCEHRDCNLRLAFIAIQPCDHAIGVDIFKNSDLYGLSLKTALHPDCMLPSIFVTRRVFSPASDASVEIFRITDSENWPCQDRDPLRC